MTFNAAIFDNLSQQPKLVDTTYRHFFENQALIIRHLEFERGF